MSEEKNTSLDLLQNVIAIDTEDEKAYDISNIEEFIKGLPETTTISKFVKSSEDINAQLDKVIIAVNYFVNSKTIYTKIFHMFLGLKSNSEFDYFKEMAKNG